MPVPFRGRPKRYAEYDALVADLPAVMTKRPRYLHGIGIFRGARGETAWIKIRLPHGGTYGGKSYPSDSSIEIKLGNRASFEWDDLIRIKDEFQGKADRGELLEAAQIAAFSEWANDWLKRSKDRLRSYATTEINVRCHLIPTFGMKAINEIRVIDINRWIADRRAIAKPGTVKREFNTLRSILNDAKRAGQLERNPCEFADKIRGEVARQRFLDGQEIVSLLAKAGDVADWLPDLIVFAIHSGMRKGEFRNLRWQDVRVIDKDHSVVLIPNSKSGQPRSVPCTKAMKEILKRQESRRVADDNLVFPVTAMTLRRKWEKARKNAGLEDVNIHDLRRTHGTHAAAAGIDLRTLAARIGHTDLTMLEKHYAALVGSQATEAAVTFERRYDQLIAAR